MNCSNDVDTSDANDGTLASDDGTLASDDSLEDEGPLISSKKTSTIKSQKKKITKQLSSSMNCSNDGGTSDANNGTLGPNPIGSVVLFSPIKKKIILSSIPSFSQRAGTRQDFLNILAGLCLLVPSLETATDKFKKEYYNTNGIKLLRERTKQLANQQKTREKTHHDVAKAITQL